MNTNAFRSLSYGVYVIGTLDGDRPTGCTANSVMQITSDPATIAISINHTNYTNSCIAKTGKFSISILGENTQASIIGTFGFQSGKDVNKFESVKYALKENMPVVTDSCAYIVCEVINKMETDTHTVFLGKVTDCDVLKKDDAMTYSYYHKVIKGKSPKAAPTYLPDEEETTPAVVYRCKICGYVYDGEIPFEELPEDYVCPICKHPKSDFVKVS